MWIVCITSVRHVLTVNGYGGRQTKENEKSWCFKGWETLVSMYKMKTTNAGRLSGLSENIPTNAESLAEVRKTSKHNGC